MAKAPERVFTRQIALLKSLGIDHGEVPEDGIDDIGVKILGAFPELGVVSYEENSLIMTTIPWQSNDIRVKAMRAKEDDFAETCGMSGDEWRKRQAVFNPDTR